MKRFAALLTGAALIATQPVFAQMGAPGTLQAAMADNDGYAALTYLCDHVGKRVSGSPQLNTAVEWGADLMKKAGLQHVQVQPVMVPRWVRGSESAALVGPVQKPLHMLGLGMSVGTPPGGITA